MVSLRRKLVIKCILHRLIVQSKRKAWVHPMNRNRSHDGEHLKVDEMYKKFPDKFFQYLRMTPVLFDKLLHIVGADMKKQDTRFRESISPRIRLYIILRYLTTGDHIRTIAVNFSMGMSTVFNIIRCDIPAIWRRLKGTYVSCPTKEEWTGIARDFHRRWNYPNCLGAIDGKHIVMQAPKSSGSLYLNYKGTFSIVLMATCDANYKFTTVDVGAYGKQSDGGVFHACSLGKRLLEGKLDTPAPKSVSDDETKIPFHFVGDEAFPLNLFMMRPYPQSSLTNEKRIFNYRLSRARRCIENAFGIMASRFRVFRRPILAAPKHVEQIVLASVALHNFILTEESLLQSTERVYCPPGFADGNDIPGGWREEGSVGLPSLQNLSVAAQERNSKKMRDDLKDYFNGAGKVDWQNNIPGLQ